MDKLGQYIPGSTLLHRLDPRVKFAAVMILSVVILKARAAEILPLSIVLAAVYAAARLTWRNAVTFLRPLSLFIGLIFLAHAFFGEAPGAAAPVPWLGMTGAGLGRGLLVAWQFVCLVLAAAVLTATTSPEELVAGMEKLLRPLRAVGVPTHELALMVSVALMLMPLLLQELARIREAQAARGAAVGAGRLRERLAAAAAVPVPLILAAFRRADAIADAMEARGYDGGPRTGLRELRLVRHDLLALLAVVLLAALIMLPAVVLVGAAGPPAHGFAGVHS